MNGQQVTEIQESGALGAPARARIRVVGAGLAGCEAAYQAARRGVEVDLYEMKPKKYSPAHHSPLFAELVCSNSLRSAQTVNAAGLLKEELHRLGSLIMEAALASEVPAGSALAVDREQFSGYITEKIRSHPLIRIHEEEVFEIPQDGITVIASGPLTSETLSAQIAAYVGQEHLWFFDAAAPIVDASTVDMEKAFFASRYNKGEAAYINCPMNREEYTAFYRELVNAREAALKEFDRDLKVFEGCMPVEIMAKRGEDTLLYGPLKPVGLTDPRTGQMPYAAVQLRAENREQTLFNLVGFQTHLAFEEQKRVFRMIPGLENAEFVRYGVMHRNTFIHSPELLNCHYGLRRNPDIFFAGQMTGVEGYIESTSSGFAAGVCAAYRAQGRPMPDFRDISVIGALAHYVCGDTRISGNFQPMNANFGIVQLLPARVKGGKLAKNQALADRSLQYIDEIRQTL